MMTTKDDNTTGETEEGLLRWFETYAQLLSNGTFGIKPIIEEHSGTLGISLFPQRPPAMQSATTRGVVVCVSTVVAPEVPTHGRPVVAYSVRFSMLADDEWPAGVPRMQSCQLRSRRWRMLNEDGEEVDTVMGDGVVGRFPLLRPGEPEVEYHSCSQQVGLGGGFMEGEFEFVPGTLEQPEGEPFWAACPRFSLSYPAIMF